MSSINSSSSSSSSTSFSGNQSYSLFNISDEDLLELDVTTLSRAQCNQLLTDQSNATIQHRLNLLPAKKLQQLLPKLHERVLSLIPTQKLNELDLVGLPCSVYVDLFWDKEKPRRPLKGHYSDSLFAEKISSIYPFLDSKIRSTLPDAVQIEKIKKESDKKCDLFPTCCTRDCTDINKVYEVITNLTVEQIQERLPWLPENIGFILRDSRADSFRKEKLHQLDLTCLTTTQCQTLDSSSVFNQLTPTQIQAVLPKLPQSSLKKIPNDKLVGLDIGKLSAKDCEILVDGKIERFDLLTNDVYLNQDWPSDAFEEVQIYQKLCWEKTWIEDSLPALASALNDHVQADVTSIISDYAAPTEATSTLGYPFVQAQREQAKSNPNRQLLRSSKEVLSSSSS
jgi:hypothetical protein